MDAGVAFAPQVSGTALTEPFTVDQRQPGARLVGRPAELHSTKLAKGQAQTYNVRITNTGSTPDEYFVDARLPGSTPLSLTSLSGPNTTVPLNFRECPAVPRSEPHHGVHRGGEYDGEHADPVRLRLGFRRPGGHFVGRNTVSGSLSANPWPGAVGIAPTVVGPFGATGAPSEPVQTTMNVATAPFDSAVSSQTGDLWLASTDPSQLSGLSPVVVGPGQTGTIPVTITPNAPSGTQVSGTLYIDDASQLGFQGLSGLTATTLPRSRTATRSSKWFGCRPVCGEAAITSVGEALR